MSDESFLDGGGNETAVAAIGGGGPSWELFARRGGGPFDGILFAGGTALLVNPSSRGEAVFAFVVAVAPSEGE